MFGNLGLLVIAHFALGLVAVFVYGTRPGAFASHGHMAGRMLALLVIAKVFVAWLPYLISGFYSCTVLPERDPKATRVFISVAVGVGIIAACLILNLFGMREPPAPLLVFGGVTVALLAAARMCAAVWRNEASGWDVDP
jgi:small-conductance mechanosensitive channel